MVLETLNLSLILLMVLIVMIVMDATVEIIIIIYKCLIVSKIQIYWNNELIIEQMM